MSEVIFVDDGITQRYGDFKGWFWYDEELNKWSNDYDKYDKVLENLNQSNSYIK